MLKATAVELKKLFSQRASYAGFAVVAGTEALVVYGTWRMGPGRHWMQGIGPGLMVAGKVVTAPFALQFILPVLMELLVPLLIAFVVGGMIAGEVRSGTMRTLLLRPVSRGAVFAAKLAAAWVYTLALCGFVFLCGAALSYMAFGPGDLVMVFGGQMAIYGHGEGMARLVAAYALAACGRLVLAAIALGLSALIDNSMTAAGLAVAVLMVFGTLEHIPYFERFQPYFLTSLLDIYRLPLAPEVDFGQMAEKAAGLCAYAIVALVPGAIFFCRRDIS